MNELASTTNNPKLLVVKRRDRLFLLADLTFLLGLWLWLAAWLDLGAALLDLAGAVLSVAIARLDLWLAVAGILGRAVMWGMT